MEMENTAKKVQEILPWKIIAVQKKQPLHRKGS